MAFELLVRDRTPLIQLLRCYRTHYPVSCPATPLHPRTPTDRRAEAIFEVRAAGPAGAAGRKKG